MTGWRCGYICLNSDSRKLDGLRENVPKLARVRISSNLPVQIVRYPGVAWPTRSHYRDGTEVTQTKRLCRKAAELHKRNLL